MMHSMSALFCPDIRVSIYRMLHESYMHDLIVEYHKKLWWNGRHIVDQRSHIAPLFNYRVLPLDYPLKAETSLYNVKLKYVPMYREVDILRWIANR